MMTIKNACKLATLKNRIKKHTYIMNLFSVTHYNVKEIVKINTNIITQSNN